MIEELNPSISVQRGVSSAEADILLVSPVGTRVKSARPTFQWRPLEGVRHYVVTVCDDQNGETVAESQPLSEAEWTPDEPLERGKIYFWTLAAVLDATGAERHFPPSTMRPAMFGVLSEDEVSELERAIQEANGSSLEAAVVYGKAGLLAEAERELIALQEAVPASDVVRELLANIRKGRGFDRGRTS